MVEHATLRLDSGDEVRVEVERDDLKNEEIVVRGKGRAYRPARRNFLEVIDEHLADPNTKSHLRGQPIGCSRPIEVVASFSARRGR